MNVGEIDETMGIVALLRMDTSVMILPKLRLMKVESVILIRDSSTVSAVGTALFLDIPYTSTFVYAYISGRFL